MFSSLHFVHLSKNSPHPTMKMCQIYCMCQLADLKNAVPIAHLYKIGLRCFSKQVISRLCVFLCRGGNKACWSNGRNCFVYLIKVNRKETKWESHATYKNSNPNLIFQRSKLALKSRQLTLPLWWQGHWLSHLLLTTHSVYPHSLSIIILCIS